jgi:hypothetical protein
MAAIPAGSIPAAVTIQEAAELPSARGDRQVRRGAGLFWAAVALILLGGVAVGLLAGNWSMSTTRGAIIAGICGTTFIGAGVCARAAIKRLLPGV